MIKPVKLPPNPYTNLIETHSKLKFSKYIQALLESEKLGDVVLDVDVLRKTTAAIFS